jgi:flagellar basal-body rod protein FlgB
VAARPTLDVGLPSAAKSPARNSLTNSSDGASGAPGIALASHGAGERLITGIDCAPDFLNPLGTEGPDIVSGISETTVIAALRRQMTVASARQVAASGNLANVDTPGYKAQEVTFDETLGRQLLPVNATYPGHHGAGEAGIAIQEAKGLEERRDGNNVQIDRELLTMTSAAGDFAAAQTALAAKFRLVRYAIAESR